MIAAYITFLLFGIVVFFLTAKLGLPLRITLALTILLIPSIILTVWIVRVGDNSPPGAVVVVPRPSPTDNSLSRRTGEAGTVENSNGGNPE